MDTQAEENLAACREAESFAQKLSAGQLEIPSDDLLWLAQEVVDQQQTRRDEDIQAWAERLARDVGQATD